MDPELYQRACDIFTRACEAAPGERQSLVDQACDGDDKLRRLVLELLANDHSLPAPEPPISFDRSLNELRSGDGVRNYVIQGLIGEGGMGLVYLAEQVEPVRRMVALKIMRAGMDTRSLLARFARERQLLALMDHPNIAKVFDAGATETGRPYFAMEYVSGMPITTWCDNHRLGIPARLALFTRTCQAIQHAHQKGVIHRDIKPSNVLVAEIDGVPAPKVIDFGIARALEQTDSGHTLHTRPGVTLGTPEYLSPEQARGVEQPDTRTDVYSLGVILYELLVGRRPIERNDLREQTVDSLKRAIVEAEPRRPSTRVRELGPDASLPASNRSIDVRLLEKLLRADLDWIVMRAIENDRERRYGSASELADDVQRYLDGKPVVARPPSVTYRVRKYMQRHRSQVVGTTAVLTAMIGGVFGPSLISRVTSNSRQTTTVAVVTSNADALRQYELGMAAFDAKDFDSMRGHFRDAVGLDSSFAMAYFQWSRGEAFWGPSDQVRRLAERADASANRETPLNQFLIHSWFCFATGRVTQLDSMLANAPVQFGSEREYLRHVARLYWYDMRMPERALPVYRELTRLYPEYAEAFNDLAYCQRELGNHAEAVAAARRYLTLQPRGPNAYDTMGDMLGLISPDSAAHYWQLAVREKSDFAVSIEKLGYLALWRGDFAGAQRRFRSLMSDVDPGEYFYRSKGNTGMATTLLCQGLFDEALATLQRGIDADWAAGEPAQAERPYKHALRALILEDLDRNEEALAEVDSALSPLAPSYHQAVDHFLPIKIRLLTKLGRFDDASRAMDTTGRVAVPAAWQYPRHESSYVLHRAAGELEKAILDLDSACVEMPRACPSHAFEQASCYLALGDEETALAKYRHAQQGSAGILRENPILFLHATLRHAELLMKTSPAEACGLCRPFSVYWERRDAILGRSDTARVRAICAQL
jgi:serine/threonine protein kinase/tetratricopeptide (TPR) repeat protein